MGKKKKISFEEFKLRFDERSNGEFEYMDGYEQMSKKIKVKCLKCKNVFEVIATAFVGTDKVQPSGCKECNKRESIEKNRDAFLSAISNEGYELIDGSYINVKSDVVLRHQYCGSEWRTRPSFFMIKGTRCPHCNNNGKRKDCKKQDFEEIKKELENKFNNINVIEDMEIKNKNSYIRNVKIVFKKCGHTAIRNAGALKSQKCAPVCKECLVINKYSNIIKDINSNLNKKEFKINSDKNTLMVNGYFNINTNNDGYSAIHQCGTINNIKNVRTHKCICQKPFSKNSAKEKVNFVSNGNCELVSDYVNKNTIIKIKNKICNHEYEIKPDAFMRSQRCRICYPVETYRNHPYTISELQEKLDITNGEGVIKILSKEYINLDSYIEIEHSCGNRMKTTTSHLLNKDNWMYCQNCEEKKSRGEILVKHYLKNKNYDFTEQFWFRDCKLKLPLRFDFVIFNSDSSIKALIEFDGMQHYREVEYFGDFEYTKLRDKIKNDYCKANNYRLIRIPYAKLNKIDEVLDQLL